MPELRCPHGREARAEWRRSWLLGFTTAVIARVRAAEQHAAAEATTPQAGPGTGAALVLADRKQVISRAVQQAYPVTRTAKVTYSGSGYGSGYAKGQQADLGGCRLPSAAGKAIGDDQVNRGELPR